MFICEIHYESTQALDEQRGALVREAAQDVYRMDAFSDEIVFRLRDEVQQHRLYAESQQGELQEEVKILFNSYRLQTVRKIVYEIRCWIYGPLPMQLSPQQVWKAGRIRI